MERDLPSLLRERAEDMRSWRTPVAANRATLIDSAAAEIEALRIERDAALSYCRILLAECEASRRNRRRLCQDNEKILRATERATDASGARTRHAKGGGA